MALRRSQPVSHALLPVGLACLAANAWLLAWLFRKQLPTGPLAARSAVEPVVDRPLAIKAILALALFCGLALAGIALAGAAMCAAAGLIVVSRGGGDAVLRSLDWKLLAFFAGLFVVVGGVQHAGLLEKMFHRVEPVINRGDAVGDLAFVAIIVIGSQLVSNLPLVLVAVAWVPHMPDPTWSYIILAVASTLAGNLRCSAASTPGPGGLQP